MMLDVEKLSVSYGPIKAVRDIEISVDQGEIVTLLGPNGAGKSSTLKAIMGLHPTASGRVVFEGKPITGMATEKIVQLGMTLTPEGRQVFSGLTVEENLKLGAASQKDQSKIETMRDEVFELFPILFERINQTAGTLSGGEQQQLAIGRSLMSMPRLLILDEPSLGLAPQIVDQIFSLIAGLRDKGLTILLVEQNAEMSLEISDRGYVFSNGEIKLEGSREKLSSSTEVASTYLGMESSET